MDNYRKEYNKMLLDKVTGANSIVQDKYVTVSVCKKNIEEARNYFARVGADLISHFARLGSKCVELEAEEKLRIFHDFYRTGEETAFHFDLKQTMRKGHDFKDFICPDTFEFEKDYFRIGDRYGRVIFLREYAAYIKDSITSRVHTKAKLPTHTAIKDFDGLSKDSVILLEQIRTIDKKRLREHIGMLDSQQILTADNALLISLGLDKKD